VPLLRIPAPRNSAGQPNGTGPAVFDECVTALYDLQTDPRQEKPFLDSVEGRLEQAMQSIMRSHDAPPEAFMRLGL
jgi:hypothetical protein